MPKVIDISKLGERKVTRVVMKPVEVTGPGAGGKVFMRVPEESVEAQPLLTKEEVEGMPDDVVWEQTTGKSAQVNGKYQAKYMGRRFFCNELPEKKERKVEEPDGGTQPGGIKRTR